MPRPAADRPAPSEACRGHAGSMRRATHAYEFARRGWRVASGRWTFGAASAVGGGDSIGSVAALMAGTPRGISDEGKTDGTDPEARGSLGAGVVVEEDLAVHGQDPTTTNKPTRIPTGECPMDPPSFLRPSTPARLPRLLRSSVTAALALWLAACDDPQPPVACETIPSQTLHVGESRTVGVCFEDPKSTGWSRGRPGPGTGSPGKPADSWKPADASRPFLHGIPVAPASSSFVRSDRGRSPGEAGESGMRRPPTAVRVRPRTATPSLRAPSPAPPAALPRSCGARGARSTAGRARREEPGRLVGAGTAALP